MRAMRARRLFFVVIAGLIGAGVVWGTVPPSGPRSLLYGVPSDRVLAASVLRARAGRLRDDAGEHADWITVADLLHQSYRALHDAVQ